VRLLVKTCGRVTVTRRADRFWRAEYHFDENSYVRASAETEEMALLELTAGLGDLLGERGFTGVTHL